MTVLSSIDTERISHRARQANPAKVIITTLAMLIFAPFWLLGRCLGWAWYGLMWSWSAAAEGWNAGFMGTPWQRSIEMKRATRAASRARAAAGG